MNNVWRIVVLGNDLSSMRVSMFGHPQSVWQAHVVPAGVDPI
jgi:hypothetical protein